jgi:hypothetical protein
MGSAKRGQASEREQLQALLHIEARARRWQEHAAVAQTRVGHGGRAALHGHHVSDTRRVVKWPAWGAVLGCLQAESLNGTKTKFDAHVKLSNFYLGTQVIRAID